MNAKLKVWDHMVPSARIVLHTGEVADLLATIPDGAVKLVVTSPPYNLGKAYETRTGLKQYLATQGEVLRQLHRVIADEGSVCWQVGNYVDKGEVFPLDIYYYELFKDLGFKLRNRIIWRFGHGLHASRRLSGRYETILWFTKGNHYTFNLDPIRIPSKYPGKRHFKGPNKGKPSGNPLGKNPSDIWEIVNDDWDAGVWDIPNVKANHPEKTNHPCQFPVELVERCVLALTNEDDCVLDPYAGVGSALIAAIKHNRRAMGAEREPTYVQVALERIELLQTGQLRLRVMGTPVFEPNGTESVARMPEEWQTRQAAGKPA